LLRQKAGRRRGDERQAGASILHAHKWPFALTRRPRPVARAFLRGHPPAHRRPLRRIARKASRCRQLVLLGRNGGAAAAPSVVVADDMSDAQAARAPSCPPMASGVLGQAGIFSARLPFRGNVRTSFAHPCARVKE
jgi:hypothetical protein